MRNQSLAVKIKCVSRRYSQLTHFISLTRIYVSNVFFQASFPDNRERHAVRATAGFKQFNKIYLN